ncbi:MAG TPA: ATP-binding protein [Thermoanaerobaculia bacterium]|nr:ATP-binding protein [Thermoanaerobaculia bacterium]
MPRPTFRFKIALLSTVLSGTVVLAFGIFFLTVIHRVGLARIDREILALGESQLKVRPDRDAGEELERSLGFIYGPDGGQRFILWVRNRFGETIYQSPNWPAGLDESRLPTPRVRHPPPDRRERRPRPEPPPGSPPFFGPPRQGESPRPPPPIRAAFATVREGGTDWRVVRLVHPRNEVMLAQDLAVLAAENARYRNAFLLAAPPALLLLALAGSWVAARALRPIEAITATAKSITARGLGERVPPMRADREIAQLIEVINGMLERLERSFQQAARFGADAAHELKTPLTILQGQLEQSLQEAPDGSPAQRTLSDLLGEVQRLRSIVRKLLLLAQADAGRLGGALETIDWSERVRELVADTRELAPHIPVSADIAPEIKVQGDQDLLVQLLQNLAGNAVKFSQGDPGAIAIELKEERGRAVFRIANTGPALGREEKERIFERFYRGDPSRNRRIDGVGLGLALAREIAHAHGGELEVDTPRAGWVRFTLVL